MSLQIKAITIVLMVSSEYIITSIASCPIKTRCDMIMSVSTSITAVILYIHVLTMRLIPVRGLGLWCLMPLSTIFQLYRGSFWYEQTSIDL